MTQAKAANKIIKYLKTMNISRRAAKAQSNNYFNIFITTDLVLNLQN
jgi:hypothetical protein